MAKVKDLLCIPVLKDIKILAGKSGLDRPVEHVTVMEVPDIKRWLKSNGMAWIYVGILYQYFTDDHYFVRYKTKNRRGIENG